MRAEGAGVARDVAPGVVSCREDKRHVQNQTAAWRTMLHMLRAAGGAGAPCVPAGLGPDAAAQFADFLKGSTYRRIAPLESDAEHSADDPA